MIKLKKTFQRYDLPLDYFLAHEVYREFYDILIPELSTLHHARCYVSLEDICNDVKFYVDRVLTSRHPELEFSKADNDIKEARLLHVNNYQNNYYSYIVRLVFYIVVYQNVQHTEAMYQTLSWTYDNIKYDSYYKHSIGKDRTLGGKIVYSCNPLDNNYKRSNQRKMVYSISSHFYDLDREFKDDAEMYDLINDTESPLLTRIVEEIADSSDKDKRQKLPLPQDVVLEILKQLCMKAGYNPDVSTNIDFARFCCLLTPYSIGKVNGGYKFDANNSLIEVDTNSLTEVKGLAKKLGIGLKLD